MDILFGEERRMEMANRRVERTTQFGSIEDRIKRIHHFLLDERAIMQISLITHETLNCFNLQKPSNLALKLRS